MTPGEEVFVKLEEIVHARFEKYELKDKKQDKEDGLLWFAILSGGRKGTKRARLLKEVKSLIEKFDVRARGPGTYYSEKLKKEDEDVGPGKPFTPTQKGKIKILNIEVNGGSLVSDLSKQVLLDVANDEIDISKGTAEIDHIHPRSAKGFNTYANAMVISAIQNKKKSAKILSDDELVLATEATYGRKLTEGEIEQLLKKRRSKK